MSISLTHARWQVFGYRVIAWIFRIAGIFSFPVWGLRNLYEFFRIFMRSPLFGNLYALVAKLIVWIYKTVPGVPTVWAHAPCFNVFRPLDASNLPNALYVGSFMGLSFWATGFSQAAASLSSNITLTETAMQREQWRGQEQPMYPQQTVKADMVIQTQIYLSSEDKWWTRPMGIVGLAIIATIIATLIAQWLMLWMGLVH